MRLHVLVLAFAAGVVFAAPAAIAEESDPAFPNLPGMGLAEDAAGGKVAPSQSTRRTDSGPTETRPEPTDDKATASETPDAAPVAALPGAGAIKVLLQEDVDTEADLTSSRATTGRLPLGLATFAALGTIVSLGSFLLLRERV